MCLPVCGIVVGYFVAQFLAGTGTPPIAAGVYGLLVLSACSVVGLSLAIVEVCLVHRMDVLAGAAILVNGLLTIPGLLVGIRLLFK